MINNSSFKEKNDHKKLKKLIIEDREKSSRIQILTLEDVDAIISYYFIKKMWDEAILNWIAFEEKLHFFIDIIVSIRRLTFNSKNLQTIGLFQEELEEINDWLQFKIDS